MTPEAYEEMSKTEATHWWFTARRKILRQVLRGLKLPKGSRILEIGSGTGGNLEMLSDFGTVSAVEMNETARKLAMEKMGPAYDIRAGRLPEDLPHGLGAFDLICLFDVLEHIREDQVSLITIRKLLGPGGHLILTVPAHAWLWGPHDRYLHHHKRYSRKDLRQALISAGFKIERLTFFNLLLFPLTAAVRLKERLFRNQRALGGEVPWGPLNRILAWIFGLERFLMGCDHMPYGISLMVVARPDLSDEPSEN